MKSLRFKLSEAPCHMRRLAWLEGYRSGDNGWAPLKLCNRMIINTKS